MIPMTGSRVPTYQSHPTATYAPIRSAAAVAARRKNAAASHSRRDLRTVGIEEREPARPEGRAQIPDVRQRGVPEAGRERQVRRDRGVLRRDRHDDRADRQRHERNLLGDARPPRARERPDVEEESIPGSVTTIGFVRRPSARP